MKKTIVMAVFLSIVACAVVSFAQDAAPDAKTRVKKEVSSTPVKEIEGTVSAISATGIAVVFGTDASKGSEEEVYVPLDKTKIRLVHMKDISEVGAGDRVKVAFKEVTDEEEGKQSKRLQATTVTFLKKAEKKPEPTIQEEPQEEGDQEQQENPQSIPLKGMKE